MLEIGTRVQIKLEVFWTSRHGEIGIITAIDTEGILRNSSLIFPYQVSFPSGWDEHFHESDLINLSKLEILGELGD